jgi:glycosyltransferase involved in cell wall biosynthesis
VKKSAAVVIIGGGIVGCSLASALANETKDVVLIEKSGISSEASGANFGMVWIQTRFPGFDLFMARETQNLYEQFVAEDFTIDIKAAFGSFGIAWRLLDFGDESFGKAERVDRVIATRFPSYVVQHPCKIVWFFHHQQELYERFQHFGHLTEESAEAGRLRQLFVQIDTKSLKEAKKVFAASAAVARKLKMYNGVESEVLYPVSPLKDKLKRSKSGDYLLTVGKIEPPARLDLLIRALAGTKSPIKCVVAGGGSHMVALKNLAAELGITERVRFAGNVSDQELISLYADCFAVAILSREEWSGYRILEAMFARKPVLTTARMEEGHELIKHNESGVLSPPRADAIAQDLQELYDDRIKSHQLGDAGYERIKKYSWDFAMEKLAAVY